MELLNMITPILKQLRDLKVVLVKVYKYKVVSTSCNDDIYFMEIIYLEKRLHVLVNILAMGSLV
jgi:hypothetical protein